jgi:AcrR family transcriptional regulator
LESRGLQNRQRILAAADRLFYQKGYNATSFSDIARVADVPRGNFYYYFRSKDDILRSVVEQRLAELQAMLDEWDRTESSPKRRLLRFVQMLSDKEGDVLQFGCPLGSLNTELGKTQRELQADAAHLLEVLAGWLERQTSELGLGERARVHALHLLSCMQGTILLANAFRDPGLLRAEIDRIRDWIEGLDVETA